MDHCLHLVHFDSTSPDWASAVLWDGYALEAKALSHHPGFSQLSARETNLWSTILNVQLKKIYSGNIDGMNLSASVWPGIKIMNKILPIPLHSFSHKPSFCPFSSQSGCILWIHIRLCLSPPYTLPLAHGFPTTLRIRSSVFSMGNKSLHDLAAAFPVSLHLAPSSAPTRLDTLFFTLEAQTQSRHWHLLFPLHGNPSPISFNRWFLLIRKCSINAAFSEIFVFLSV